MVREYAFRALCLLNHNVLHYIVIHDIGDERGRYEKILTRRENKEDMT